jgi:DNA-binding transcriptional regulator YiaG
MTGKDLRTRREALGLSQPALARLLCCNQNSVYMWETGKRPIGPMLTANLERVLAQAAATKAPPKPL